jgi:hypothetical protein
MPDTGKLESLHDASNDVNRLRIFTQVNDPIFQILEGLIGGPDRDRTDDLFHAMEARSQLRHRPTQRKDLTILADATKQVNSSRNLSCLSGV